MNAVLLKKRAKICRDTDEQTIMKAQYTVRVNKRKCRRFCRKGNEDEQVEEPVDEPMEEPNDSRINGKVKNLSSRNLDKDEKDILELGPKFCPVEIDLDRSRLQKEINEGFRRMKIKDFFHPDEDSRTDEQKRFYVKNTDWDPPAARVNKSLDVFNMIVQNKFDNWKQPVGVKDNLSVAQRKALKSLSNDERIDIKLDDKSGSFVVADKKDYISAASNDLSKQANIQETHVNNVENIVSKMETEIACVVQTCVTSGEILSTTAGFIMHTAKKHDVA